MSACERCWGEAARMVAFGETNLDQTALYSQLVKERNVRSCTAKEQAGQWWDEEKQCDSREARDE